MAKIAYYISDHGFGHASRSIAVIRALKEKFDDIEIYVNCSYPLKFARESLMENREIKFRRVKNDFGYVSDENIEIDVDKTESRFRNWLKRWKSYIAKEKEFCKSGKIDLIISDISPQPFIVGDDLGIPSIGISNFTWYEIYRDLFGQSETVEKLKEAYEKANLGLIYPFETNTLPFNEQKKISLVSRENTRDFKEVREEIGVKEEEKLVYFGVGKSYFGNGNRIQFEDKFRDKFSLLVSSGHDLIEEPDCVIPKYQTESQDYIGACDLIISKFGYGVVSEGIKSRTPMILSKRNILENEEGMKKLKRHGMAEEITREDLIEGNYMKIIESILEKDFYEDIPKRLKRDGRKDIIESMEEFIK